MLFDPSKYRKLEIELIRGVLPGEAAIQNRLQLVPPSDSNLPRMIYFPRGEVEMLEALKSGEISAVARGEIGNRLAAEESNGKLKVVSLFGEERMGFAVGSANNDLREQINYWTDLLTENGQVGFQEVLDDPSIYSKRAGKFLANNKSAF